MSEPYVQVEVLSGDSKKNGTVAAFSLGIEAAHYRGCSFMNAVAEASEGGPELAAALANR